MRDDQFHWGKIYSFKKWLIENWWIGAIINAVPAAALTIVELVGDKIWLQDPATGNLNTTGATIVWITVSIALVYSFLNSYADLGLYEENTNATLFARGVLRGLGRASNYQYERTIDDFEKDKPITNEKIFSVIRPETQIQSTINEIKATFTELMGKIENRVGVSLVYRTIQGEWIVVAKTINVSSRKSVIEKLYDEKSAFHQVKTGQKQIYFVPNKKKAAAENKYSMGAKDLSAVNPGSLICMRIEVEGKGNKIESILSVSTYGEPLYPEDGPARFTYEKKIEDLILAPFAHRLRSELVMLFLKEQANLPLEDNNNHSS